MDTLENIFPEDILEKYEIYNYYHAAEILETAYPEEFNDLIDVLRNVDISLMTYWKQEEMNQLYHQNLKIFCFQGTGQKQEFMEI